VRDKLEAMRGEDEDGRAAAEIESLITNWTDAVRHFDSALANGLPAEIAQHNRKLVMTYLKRLQELLQEEEEQTGEQIPQPPPDEAQPQPGEGEGEPEESDEKGEPREDGSERPGDEGGGDPQEDESPGAGEDEENPDDKSGKREDEEESSDEPLNPGETPEERARRILSDNADLEKGPLSPGQFEFSPPEKDW
jgi:hypothetical protein